MGTIPCILLLLLACAGYFMIALLISSMTNGRYPILPARMRFLHSEGSGLNPYFRLMLKALRENKATCQYEYCYVTVKFDNMVIKFWDANRWYSWASRGSIDVTNEDNTISSFKWHHKRPSSKLIDALIPFFKDTTYDDTFDIVRN